MIEGKKIVVVLPAYNAASTLEATYREIPPIVDEIILVDDASSDDTVALAEKLGIKHIIRHEKNRGYGGNQKTCYKAALSLGAYSSYGCYNSKWTL
ncbi:MAG: glycosyltransferase [Candidatus Anstonellales archaeon]